MRVKGGRGGEEHVNADANVYAIAMIIMIMPKNMKYFQIESVYIRLR